MSIQFLDDFDIYDDCLPDHPDDPASIFYLERFAPADEFLADDYIISFEQYEFDWRKEGF
jgi:hypothetical protein